MPYKEQPTEKLYYSMSEVSDMFNINQSNIRFWEKEFDILKPKKNKKGNRMFTREDVENLKIIYHLVKERGYTLEGAKMKLKGNKEDIDKSIHVVESLNRIKSFLLEVKEEL